MFDTPKSGYFAFQSQTRLLKNYKVFKVKIEKNIRLTPAHDILIQPIRLYWILLQKRHIWNNRFGKCKWIGNFGGVRLYNGCLKSSNWIFLVSISTMKIIHSVVFMYSNTWKCVRIYHFGLPLTGVVAVWENWEGSGRVQWLGWNEIKFVWVTEGTWRVGRRRLEERFNIIEIEFSL